ncbi:uncharacterized protein EV420DRAFT_1303172 [Desarmillaria tabescens]|uniref:Uncharacterized protein n=1 Tax=Armillaria tabescens TaxID=1929756 RepID=A0AA39TS85_ARMTA|nr:uncharacterized protein EV420DRAFT_1753593 [Desarmillaria tabescens]XP_060335909.1 uncharacterized protein EV420DRAFT_1303172 [Desarmillaria tabescens]KAK0437141.1 hypothetical protein EV420DRAFT_1753593 [Desarmillaria tabescens]KAK0464788.1 hypothetical protein EV420DRAFT_1303172 [Desarmillaria tabescens]
MRYIPQELIDEVIAFVHDDMPTLKTCALVSHAFLPSSRKHTFSRVILAQKDYRSSSARPFSGGIMCTCDNFHSLLRSSPYIAFFVVSLRMVHFQVEYGRGVRGIYHEDTLPCILDSLQNLQRITVGADDSKVSWRMLPSVFKEALFRSFSLPSVQCIDIDQLEDIDLPRTLMGRLAGSPSLKRLSLNWIEYSRAPRSDGLADADVREPVIRPRLEALELSGYDCPVSAMYLSGPNSLFDTHHLRELSVGFTGKDLQRQRSLVQAIIDQASNTLECLVYRQLFEWDSSLSQGPLLKTEHLARLRSLYVSVDFVPPPALIPLTRTLEELKLLVILRGNHVPPCHEWSLLDEHIGHCRDMPSLRSVDLKLHSQCGHNCYSFLCTGAKGAETLRASLKEVKKSLPILRHRGILSVEAIRVRRVWSGEFN